MGIFVTYFIFAIIIISGILKFYIEKPRIYEIDRGNNSYFITFPGKPKQFDVEDAIKRLTVKKGNEEFSLVYKNLVEDNSIIVLTDRFDLKLDNMNIETIYKEVKTIDSYYVLSAMEEGYFIFKKFVLHEGLLLDLTIKSKNRFPNEKEKIFLDYVIQEK